MNIITGKTGKPHITAQQDRDINCAIFGNDCYVLPVGEQLKAEQQTSNTIRIRDGLLVMQGCAASIDSGAFDDVQIENGSQGVNRIDLIVARYTQEIENGFESVKIQVIKGTPAESPKAPAVQSGEIRKGVKIVDFVLYEVTLKAITVESVTKKFKTVDRSLYDLAKNQKTLWSSNYGYYMASDQTIAFSEPVSAQPNGIVLVWTGVKDGQSVDSSISLQFVPKKAVSMFNDKGFSFTSFGYNFDNIFSKYVYISDSKIRGNDLNMEKGSKAGITFNNSNGKLRAVIGV